jgi:hypothetical protein
MKPAEKMESNKKATRTSYLNYILLVLFFMLLFFYAPVRYLNPYFLAEEGSLYFPFAYNNSLLASLFTPHLGYYYLLANLATSAAANLMPLEHAPVLTTFAGSLVWILLATLVLMRSSPFDTIPQKALILLLIVLVPPHFGKVHTTFTQFLFCFCSCLILVSEARTKLEKYVHRVVLLIAGLTGVTSLFLTPLYVLKMLRNRKSKERLVQCAILVFCGIVQLFFFYIAMKGSHVSPSRFSMLEPDILLATIFNRSIIPPFFGIDAMSNVGLYLYDILVNQRWTSSYILLTTYLALAIVILCWLIVGIDKEFRSQTSRYLLGAFLLVILFSFLLAITNQKGTKSFMIIRHHRYFVAPNMILVTALGFHALSRVKTKMVWLYRLVVIGLLFSCIHSYLYQTPKVLLTGPDWREEVAAWELDPSHKLQIWPKGSYMVLERDRERD